MTQENPSLPKYPVLPLRDIVVFPHMIVPLFVGREKSVRALEDVMKEDKQILLVTQTNAAQDDPGPADIYADRHGRHRAAAAEAARRHREGAGRRRHARQDRGLLRDRSVLQSPARARWRESDKEGKEVEALARSVITQFEQYIKLNKKIPPEVLVSVNQIEDPSKLADTVASHLTLKISDKQELLEIASVSARLEKVFSFMEGEIGVLQVEKRIRSRVKRQMEKTQREYYLNEQMKAIQKELGESEDGRDELAELEERIKKTKLSKEAPREGRGGGQEAPHHEPDVGRSDGRPQLSRLAAVDSLEQADQDQEGHQARREGAERRPLRPGEGQGAHP